MVNTTEHIEHCSYSIDLLTRISGTYFFFIGYAIIRIANVDYAIRVKVLLNYVLNFATATLAFLSLGYSSAFGMDIRGIVGIMPLEKRDLMTWNQGILGWGATILGTTIIQSAIPERSSIIINLIITSLVTGMFLPIIIHWVWTKDGWTQHPFLEFCAKSSFIDTGGGVIVHSFAGGFALITFCSSNWKQMEKSKNKKSIDAEIATVVGYVLVITGAVFSHHIYAEKIILTQVLLDSVVAEATGMLCVGLINIIIKKPVDGAFIINTLQGGLASFVTVSPGISTYNLLFLVPVSGIGSILYWISSRIIKNKGGCRDPLNIISIHWLSGILGSLLIVFLKPNTNSAGEIKLGEVMWQVICLIAINLVSFLLAFVLLSLPNVSRFFMYRRKCNLLKECSNLASLPQTEMGDKKSSNRLESRVDHMPYVRNSKLHTTVSIDKENFIILTDDLTCVPSFSIGSSLLGSSHTFSRTLKQDSDECVVVTKSRIENNTISYSSVEQTQSQF